MENLKEPPIRRYLCERCGGIGIQPEKCWNQETKQYDEPEGKCTTCNGKGYLGIIE